MIVDIGRDRGDRGDVESRVIEYVEKGRFDDRGKPFVSDNSLLLQTLHFAAISTSTCEAALFTVRRGTHVSLTILDVYCFR